MNNESLDADLALRLRAAWWPLSRLGEGLEALARHSGLATAPAEALLPPADLQDDVARAQRWLDWAAARLGLEVEAVDGTVPQIAGLLAAAGPALLPWHDAASGMGFLLLLRPARGRAGLLTPDLRVQRVPRAALRHALAWQHEAPLQAEVDAVLASAAVPLRRQAAVRAALLRDRLAGVRITPWWLLRLPATAPAWQQARLAGLPQQVVATLAVFAALYALEIGAWALIGAGVLDGRLDLGWLAAWLLLLLLMLPLQLLGTGLHAGFALGASRLLKSRLLAGALRLDVDAVRRQGVGGLLGRVIESQALESLAVGGGLATLVGLLELLFAAGVLGVGAAPAGHLLLLLAWLGLTVALAVRYGHRLRDWTLSRLGLTHELIEQMVGHRTRLAQERPVRRDTRDDAALQGYLDRSAAMDKAALPLQSALPSAWIGAALAVLVPAFVAGGTPVSALAISLGGILLAQRAFSGIVGGLSSLARAGIAWQQVAGLFRAGARQADEGPALFVDREGAAPTQGTLVDAQGLHFGHPGAQPLLQGVDLRILAGQRLLLQGASGGGKSTLGALLTGLRRPQAGLLLMQGLDAPTLGDQWFALATAAPQFHENHVLSGSVAFNLLMGRQWPAGPGVLKEAEALCHELGLADLLQRMPAGLQQRIGETGWQLSHGERSRLFLARALLQRAPLTVLDESFAALDPETLALCLRTVLRRAQAVLVIAHP